VELAVDASGQMGTPGELDIAVTVAPDLDVVAAVAEIVLEKQKYNAPVVAAVLDCTAGVVGPADMVQYVVLAARTDQVVHDSMLPPDLKIVVQTAEEVAHIVVVVLPELHIAQAQVHALPGSDHTLNSEHDSLLKNSSSRVFVDMVQIVDIEVEMIVGTVIGVLHTGLMGLVRWYSSSRVLPVHNHCLEQDLERC
jgi:hypothetical protein